MQSTLLLLCSITVSVCGFRWQAQMHAALFAHCRLVLRVSRIGPKLHLKPLLRPVRRWALGTTIGCWQLSPAKLFSVFVCGVELVEENQRRCDRLLGEAKLCPCLPEKSDAARALLASLCAERCGLHLRGAAVAPCSTCFHVAAASPSSPIAAAICLLDLMASMSSVRAAPGCASRRPASQRGPQHCAAAAVHERETDGAKSRRRLPVQHQAARSRCSAPAARAAARAAGTAGRTSVRSSSIAADPARTGTSCAGRRSTRKFTEFKFKW
eukprot:SAG31_NODE_3782_length_3884_cov_1.601057_2_plen_269_part_00